MINYIITSIYEYMNHHRPRPDESVIESLADKWLSATQMARGPEVGRRIPRPGGRDVHQQGVKRGVQQGVYVFYMVFYMV